MRGRRGRVAGGGSRNVEHRGGLVAVAVWVKAREMGRRDGEREGMGDGGTLVTKDGDGSACVRRLPACTECPVLSRSRSLSCAVIALVLAALSLMLMLRLIPELNNCTAGRGLSMLAARWRTSAYAGRYGCAIAVPGRCGPRRFPPAPPCIEPPFSRPALSVYVLTISHESSSASPSNAACNDTCKISCCYPRTIVLATAYAAAAVSYAIGFDPTSTADVEKPEHSPLRIWLMVRQLEKTWCKDVSHFFLFSLDTEPPPFSVESGFLLSVSQLVSTLYFTATVAVYLVIAPTLVIVRVGMGKGFDSVVETSHWHHRGSSQSHRGRQAQLRSIRFAEHHTTDISHLATIQNSVPVSDGQSGCSQSDVMPPVEEDVKACTEKAEVHLEVV
ncbi:hypothetical protein EVG20_g5689 [Dentipellis fragilis]|uniref:Uncharacterized protein n=1 Tax=Dentipellis fragilis TaxID=205917 RepID=A0A4Y9YS02_9AGAM|nr:hypothetical protein EVG20_g5689 [Dentipellis fragilis]